MNLNPAIQCAIKVPPKNNRLVSKNALTFPPIWFILFTTQVNEAQTIDRDEYLFGTWPESCRRWDCSDGKIREWTREGELKLWE